MVNINKLLAFISINLKKLQKVMRLKYALYTVNTFVRIYI